jgi:hypothetical protein
MGGVIIVGLDSLMVVAVGIIMAVVDVIIVAADIIMAVEDVIIAVAGIIMATTITILAMAIGGDRGVSTLVTTLTTRAITLTTIHPTTLTRPQS